MGCDIHTYALRVEPDKGVWLISRDVKIEPYGWIQDTEFLGYRNYSMFAFLTSGEVRNYSKLKGGLQPERDHDKVFALMPIKKFNQEFFSGHTPCMLTIEQLTGFDYDQLMVDKEDNDGTVQTYREFLGQRFFADIEEMKRKGVTHFIFWFDN